MSQTDKAIQIYLQRYPKSQVHCLGTEEGRAGCPRARLPYTYSQASTFIYKEVNTQSPIDIVILSCCGLIVGWV